MAEYEVRKRETVVRRDPLVRDEPVVSETVVEREPALRAQRQVVEDPSASGRVLVARISGIIWLLFGVLDALIILRVVLKFIAANPTNDFSNFIYSFTNIFLSPFNSLIASPVIGNGVFEISSLVALVVYTLLAWLIVRLFRLIFTPARTRQTVTTVRRDL
ncbi:MAG: YggT family protein [Chloroflexota bacterium]